MPRPLNLVGQEFERLRVVEEGASRGGKTYWLCECSCAARTRKEVQGHLTQGAILSCGCLRDERTRARSVTHGQTGTKLYDTWGWMKWRCSPNAVAHRDHSFDWGIRVCESWVGTFEQFAAGVGPHLGQGTSVSVSFTAGFSG